jgi:hypothetical protein
MPVRYNYIFIKTKAIGYVILEIASVNKWHFMIMGNFDILQKISGKKLGCDVFLILSVLIDL